MPYHFVMRTVIEANENRGHHFFERGTKRFFKSRIHPMVYGGRFFVTSEKGPDDIRAYTVRKINDDGSIETVSKFQQYNSSRVAHNAAKRFAKGQQ